MERKGLIDPRPPHSQGPGEHISLLLVAMGGMDIKGTPNPQPQALADYLNLFPDGASSFLKKAETKTCET